MGGDSREVFGLDQRYLSASRSAGIAIANDALRNVEVGAFTCVHRLAPPGRTPSHTTCPGLIGAINSCTSMEEGFRGIRSPAQHSRRQVTRTSAHSRISGPSSPMTGSRGGKLNTEILWAMAAEAFSRTMSPLWPGG